MEKPAKMEKSSKKDYFEIRMPRFKFSKISNNIYIVAAFLIFAVAFGMLTNKVSILEKKINSQDKRVTELQSAAPQAAPTEDLGPKNVSVDNDPVLGEKNAPVTMVEFSDYECPFCKRYFDRTYPQLKKDYVDTGKLKIVYRDFPLPFHQNAHKEAEAAECIREQGGDSVYYQFHDAIFKQTSSNGTGLALTQLAPIANEIGLSGSQLQTCLDSNKYKTEVDQDIAAGSKIGITGTPTFLIGKSDSSGTILGIKIVGAQPYSEFKRVIDEELKK